MASRPDKLKPPTSSLSSSSFKQILSYMVKYHLMSVNVIYNSHLYTKTKKYTENIFESMYFKHYIYFFVKCCVKYIKAFAEKTGMFLISNTLNRQTLKPFRIIISKAKSSTKNKLQQIFRKNKKTKTEQQKIMMINYQQVKKDGKLLLNKTSPV